MALASCTRSLRRSASGSVSDRVGQLAQSASNSPVKRECRNSRMEGPSRMSDSDTSSERTPTAAWGQRGALRRRIGHVDQYIAEALSGADAAQQLGPMGIDADRDLPYTGHWRELVRRQETREIRYDVELEACGHQLVYPVVPARNHCG